MQDLAHFVADEDNTLPFADELLHNGKQPLDLDIGQCGRGFVQDQQLRTVVQRLQYLGALLFAHGYLGDKLVQLHVQTVLGRQLLDLLAASRPVDKQALGVLVAQDDIFKDSHCLHQHKVLVHHADSQLDCLAGGLDPHLFAIEEYLSLRGLIKADENVHQRGLTGTVLTQQGQYLAAVDGQADILVGVKITKPLADMLHTQQLAQVPSLPFVHVFAKVVIFHLENDNRPRSVLKY